MRREAIEALFHRSLFDLRTPFMRIPLVLSRRFWAFALEQTDDPLIGLAAGRRFVSTATNGLTYLFDVAVSLESACDYFVRFFPFFNGHLGAQIVRDGDVQSNCVCSTLAACKRAHRLPITSSSACAACCGANFSPVAWDVIRCRRVDLAFADAVKQYESACVRQCMARKSTRRFSLIRTCSSAALTPGNHGLEQTLVELLEQTRSNSESTLLEQVSDYLIEDLAKCQLEAVLQRSALGRAHGGTALEGAGLEFFSSCWMSIAAAGRRTCCRRGNWSWWRFLIGWVTAMCRVSTGRVCGGWGVRRGCIGLGGSRFRAQDLGCLDWRLRRHHKTHCPTATLDPTSPGVTMVFRSICFHSGLAPSRALKR
jgi:hypothetical protein